MERQAPILIAYDGSENARHAIERAGELFTGRPSLILHVWEPVELAALRHGAIGMSATVLEPEADETAETLAERVAAEGATLAGQAGLDAQAEAVESTTSVWETIVGVAAGVEASVIVLGSRGLRGMRSLVLGSVSSNVAHHAHQPVLIVPTPALAAARREQAATPTGELMTVVSATTS